MAAADLKRSIDLHSTMPVAWAAWGVALFKLGTTDGQVGTEIGLVYKYYMFLRCNLGKFERCGYLLFYLGRNRSRVSLVHAMFRARHKHLHFTVEFFVSLLLLRPCTSTRKRTLLLDNGAMLGGTTYMLVGCSWYVPSLCAIGGTL